MGRAVDGIDLHRCSNIETSLLKSKAHASCSSEQVNTDWALRRSFSGGVRFVMGESYPFVLVMLMVISAQVAEKALSLVATQSPLRVNLHSLPAQPTWPVQITAPGL